MQHQETPSNKIVQWIKTSITARMAMVGFLTLVLIIPLVFVQELIQERARRQQEVIAEINDKWGEELLVYGPILKIPYKSYTEKAIKNTETQTLTTETVTQTNYAYFFPETLDIKSAVNPEVRNRSIYKTTVFSATAALEGTFSMPDFTEAGVQPEDIEWENARIILKTSNLKGVSEAVRIKMGTSAYDFVSQYDSAAAHTTLDEVPLHLVQSAFLKTKDVPQEGKISFQMDLKINGSEQIRFVPVGKSTSATITSTWKTASFIGDFLPHNTDKFTAEGFNAKWNVLDINRPFSQQFFNTLPNLTAYAFGVNFMIPVDHYQKSERTAKYGFLVIGLTFLIFFMIQTLSKIGIHPFQYLMIGIALVLFYTLLIALTEHSNFLTAYLISGSMVIVLISLYTYSILKHLKFALFIAAALTLLYGFIYVIIQLEQYALLVGSLGLFTILALVMFTSRKIDWNS